jgi:site-specific DNA-methyltransferase (cytosine-N4-specific)
MVGQPWRLAFALQADGWWLRSDVIWAKPNPMPESSKDRPTKAHEYLFLLAKSERYYLDHEAIKEVASEDTHARYARGRSTTHKHAQAELVPGQRPQTISQSFEHMRKPVAGWDTGVGAHSVLDYNQIDPERSTKLLRKLAEPGSGTKNNTSFDAAMAVMPEFANKRSVWTVPTFSFPGAHFATFPPDLIVDCIKASCPVGGTVLDPFGGAGTTGLVADRLGRSAVLCELNADYVTMGDRRIAGDSGHVGRQIRLEASP